MKNTEISAGHDINLGTECTAAHSWMHMRPSSTQLRRHALSLICRRLEALDSELLCYPVHCCARRHAARNALHKKIQMDIALDAHPRPLTADV